MSIQQNEGQILAFAITNSKHKARSDLRSTLIRLQPWS